MKTATIAKLVIALVVGVCAAIATYSLVDPHAPRHPANAHDDSDPGLIP